MLFRAVSEAPHNPGLAAIAKSAGVRKLAVLAPAKINLFLHVGQKRRDNYHALESLVVFAEMGDRLEFAPADELTLKLGGPFAAQTPRGEDNLVLKGRPARARHYRIATTFAQEVWYDEEGRLVKLQLKGSDGSTIVYRLV